MSNLSHSWRSCIDKATHNKKSDILHKFLNKTSCQIWDKKSNELQFKTERVHMGVWNSCSTSLFSRKCDIFPTTHDGTSTCTVERRQCSTKGIALALMTHQNLSLAHGKQSKGRKRKRGKRGHLDQKRSISPDSTRHSEIPSELLIVIAVSSSNQGRSYKFLPMTFLNSTTSSSFKLTNYPSR